MTETSLETKVQDIILKCGGCSTPLQDPELPLISCPSCGAAHHVDCAAAQGKCSAYGCNSILEVDENKYLPGIGKVVYELGKKYVSKSLAFTGDFLLGCAAGALLAPIVTNIMWYGDYSDKQTAELQKNSSTPLSSATAIGLITGAVTILLGEYIATSVLIYNILPNLPHEHMVFKTGASAFIGAAAYPLGKLVLNKITYVGYHAINKGYTTCIKPFIEDYKKTREQLTDPLYHKIKKLKEEQQQALLPAEEKKSNEDIK